MTGLASLLISGLLLVAGISPVGAVDQSPWASSIDPASKSRFIPVELWTGADWDGSKELKMSNAELRFGDRLNKDIKGPMEWKHPMTGETLIVYERINQERDGIKSQLFAMNGEKRGWAGFTIRGPNSASGPFPVV